MVSLFAALRRFLPLVAGHPPGVCPVLGVARIGTAFNFIIGADVPMPVEPGALIEDPATVAVPHRFINFVPVFSLNLALIPEAKL